MPSKAVLRMYRRHTTDAGMLHPSMLKPSLARARVEADLLACETRQAHVDADKRLGICMERFSGYMGPNPQSPRVQAQRANWKQYTHLKCEAEDLGLVANMHKQDVAAYDKRLTLVEAVQAEEDRKRQVKYAWDADPNAVPRPHLAEIKALDTNLDLPAIGYLVTYRGKVLEYACYTGNEYKQMLGPKRGFGAASLDVMTDFARNEGNPAFDAANGWGDTPYLVMELHPNPNLDFPTAKHVWCPTVARVFDHFRAVAEKQPGWGKYAIPTLELAQVEEIEAHSGNVKTDWIHGDPRVFEEHFWEAVEAKRPKADGPFGMLRLGRHLMKYEGYGTGIRDCLRAYAQEHANEFPVIVARADKPAVEPLFVITHELESDEQTKLYPRNARGNIDIPDARPWSPTREVNSGSDSDEGFDQLEAASDSD